MKKILAGLIMGMSVLSTNVLADQNSDMLAKIQKEYPKLNVKKATFLPNVKLFEIQQEGNKGLSYTNENLDYFILNGRIIDPKNKTDVSTEREIQSTKDFFTSLPFDKAIPIKFGNGERKVAVFTDPDCPFCKSTDQAIHNQMTQDNVTFYYFMNPLDIPGHERAPQKAKQIWCSPNPSEAWKNWMVDGVLAQNDGLCNNPVEDTMKLSEDNNFLLTPIMIFDSGIVWRGKIEPTQIREVLTTYPVKK